jgi:hypothetical protein
MHLNKDPISLFRSEFYYWVDAGISGDDFKLKAHLNMVTILFLEN